MATSATAPSTSPVMPPSRRTASAVSATRAPPGRRRWRRRRSSRGRPLAPTAARTSTAPRRPDAPCRPPARRARRAGRHGTPRRQASIIASRAATAAAPRPPDRARALGLSQRADLDEQREHQRDDAERPDVRLLHDLQRLPGGLAAAEAVGRSARPSRCRPRVSPASAAIASAAASSGPVCPARHASSTPAAAPPSTRPTDGRPVHRGGGGPPAGTGRATAAGQRHRSEQRDRQPQSSPGHGTRAYGLPGSAGQRVLPA